MAEAIFCRLISAGELVPQEVTVSDINIERLDYLYKNYGVKTSNSNVNALDYSKGPIIIAVKPQQASQVLKEVGRKTDERLVISIAAGIKISLIEKYLEQARVVRVMPNVAALAGSAITAVSKGSRADTSDLEIVRKIFSAIGTVIEIDESLQDAVVAISGSGPAYFFYLTELLIEAGLGIGLDEEKSRQLAIRTAIGAGELLKTGKSPKELRKMVTSPGGTTEAAIKSLDDNKFSAIVKSAVQSAQRRAKDLSKG